MGLICITLFLNLIAISPLKQQAIIWTKTKNAQIYCECHRWSPSWGHKFLQVLSFWTITLWKAPTGVSFCLQPSTERLSIYLYIYGNMCYIYIVYLWYVSIHIYAIFLQQFIKEHSLGRYFMPTFPDATIQRWHVDLMFI